MMSLANVSKLLLGMLLFVCWLKLKLGILAGYDSIVLLAKLMRQVLRIYWRCSSFCVLHNSVPSPIAYQDVL